MEFQFFVTIMSRMSLFLEKWVGVLGKKISTAEDFWTYLNRMFLLVLLLREFKKRCLELRSPAKRALLERENRSVRSFGFKVMVGFLLTVRFDGCCW